MAKVGYCSGCGRRVELTAQGECPQGHLRSMLRDVRDGVEPPAAPKAESAPKPPAQEQHSEWLMEIIGKSVVLVPLALLIAFALWTGYLQVVGSGGSKSIALLSSLGSVILTIGLVYLMSRRKKS